MDLVLTPRQSELWLLLVPSAPFRSFALHILLGSVRRASTRLASAIGHLFNNAGPADGLRGPTTMDAREARVF